MDERKPQDAGEASVAPAAFDPLPWREQTRAARLGRIHLNNAGASLMPDPVLETIGAHLRLEAEMGGYEAADAASPEIDAAYRDVAALVGAGPRNVAIVENATVAVAQALSAFDFAPGDVILTTRNDYISNQLMYLSLARRAGVEVVHAEDAPDGGVDAQSVRELLRTRRPKLVALTWIPTNSGLVQPAAAVGAECEEAGVPYLLDACQAVGQLEIDVATLRCDYLAATARKFLRGPRGIGFLYVSDRALARGDHPLFVDMRGADWTDAAAFRLADDARRFENWEFAYALVRGMGEAARYARRVGVAEGGQHAGGLAARLREALARLPRVRVLDRGPELCAIATATIEGIDATSIVERLREEAINTSATFRAWAVLDMDAKRVRDAVRISPHYYNTVREIDNVTGAIEDMVTS